MRKLRPKKFYNFGHRLKLFGNFKIEISAKKLGQVGESKLLNFFCNNVNFGVITWAQSYITLGANLCQQA